jgi:hypothetical protein
MGNVNRKATGEEMDHVAEVIRAAFPDCEPVFGGHSAYGGHRAPRANTISFRLRDGQGKYRSNVVWLPPEWLSSLTVGNILWLVNRANGKKPRRKKRS